MDITCNAHTVLFSNSAVLDAKVDRIDTYDKNKSTNDHTRQGTLRARSYYENGYRLAVS